MKSPHYSRFGIMGQNDGRQKHGGNPRSPTSPTVEHLMGDSSKWSPHASPTYRGGYVTSKWSPQASPTSRRDHDPEDDHTPHKKSVLSKVKERARKLRYSLSGKKKHLEGENVTPSWGVTLEDDEYEEEDAEYLGAPMYESELAPENYKENARLHPRLIPVKTEKQFLSSSIEENEKPPSPNKTVNGQENEKPPAPNRTVSGQENEKPPPPIKIVNGQENEKTPNLPTPSKALTSPSKPLTETVTEKLAPAYATVSDATHAIASKIQGLTVSALSATETKNHTIAESNKQDNLATLKQAIQEIDTKTNPEAEKQESPTGKLWDKGVSVKEYIMNKLDPGEEERALSKVITDVMSPKRSPREVVGKMKEAVTSFLWHEESPQSSMTQSPTNASTSIPVSTNADEVFEEANDGRVLQTN